MAIKNPMQIGSGLCQQQAWKLRSFDWLIGFVVNTHGLVGSSDPREIRREKERKTHIIIFLKNN
ncbi:hypothetical protein TorRG33x02_062440, partial [Trema orientale]